MNPINIICYSCDTEFLVEPEVWDDLESLCASCGNYLFEQEEDVNELLW